MCDSNRDILVWLTMTSLSPYQTFPPLQLTISTELLNKTSVLHFQILLSMTVLSLYLPSFSKQSSRRLSLRF